MKHMEERKVFRFDDERIARSLRQAQIRQALITGVLQEKSSSNSFYEAFDASKKITWNHTDEEIINS